MNEEKDIVVLYHGNCPDGFGGAYAAWKKFGDTAEYMPLSRGKEAPVQEVEGKDAYFIDFTYDQSIMDQFIAAAKSVTVLDHHEGMREVIESMPHFVYDASRSGAGIAWDFFHEGTPRPALLNHVEDDDLFRYTIADTREIITYLEVQPFTFETWDDISLQLDDPASKEAILVKARTYREYFEILAHLSVDHAKLISFEGYEVYFANSHPLGSMKSYIGNVLARKHGPFALVVSAHPNGYGVSIRGDGSVDVSKIAQKFGGNGHPDASGFLIPREGPFPWEVIEHKEEA